MSAHVPVQSPATRPPRGKATMIAGAALLLLSAIALQFLYVLNEAPTPKPRERIAEILPKSLRGWEVADERLGATETVNEATLKVLNLDDYVYRRFRRGEVSFTVYAAYWAPGRMPTRLVASHTPDRCWTENGMRCIEMRFRQAYQVRSRALLPAEYRAFTAPNGAEKTFVAYWHIVDGKIYDYGARFNAVPDPWLWWKDTVAQATHGSREQFFVRIASTTPLEELWKNPDFAEVMGQVAGLGLWAETAAKN